MVHRLGRRRQPMRRRWKRRKRRKWLEAREEKKRGREGLFPLTQSQKGNAVAKREKKRD